MERWSSWFSTLAFFEGIKQREGMHNCDVECYVMTSGARAIVRRYADVDIWQGDLVLRMEMEHMVLDTFARRPTADEYERRLDLMAWRFTL